MTWSAIVTGGSFYQRAATRGVARQCARQDSNLRPLPPQGSALSPELRARGWQVEPCLGAADLEHGVVFDLAADIAERSAGNGARHAPDRLPVADDLIAGRSVLDLEHPQPAVRAAAVVQPRDRLLAGVAALGEGDVRLVDPGLGGQDRLVELAAPDGRAGLDPQALELLVRRGGLVLLLGPALDRLDAVVVVRDPLTGPELEVAAVRLRLDLALGGEARAQQRRADRLRERGVGDQQERLRPLAYDSPWRDDPAVRRQQQGRARLARLEGRDLVREHALEEVRRLRAGHGHVAAIQPIARSGHRFHAFSVGTPVHSNGGESQRACGRYSSRPTSPSPSYETALGPFRRCRSGFPKIAALELAPTSPDRRWTLVAVCTTTFMLLLDITVVNVALPNIQRDLDASLTGLQWVVDAYALTLAALILTAGALSDRYGRRLLFIAGVVVFTLSSLMCGLAWNIAVLDISRAVQGVGGAALFATALALIGAEYQGREIGGAIAIWGAHIGPVHAPHPTGGRAASGRVLGGVIAAALGWRWRFFVTVPVGAFALVAAFNRMRESRGP